jgi:hypothetical protein
LITGRKSTGQFAQALFSAAIAAHALRVPPCLANRTGSQPSATSLIRPGRHIPCDATRTQHVFATFKRSRPWKGIVMIRQYPLGQLLFALIVILLVLGSRILAAPDPPIVVAPDHLQFTADQHLGISSRPGGDFTSPPINVIDVGPLSRDITPASGISGVVIERVRPAGADGTLSHIDGWPGATWNVSDGHLLVNYFNAFTRTTGGGAHGIVARDRGGDGGNGVDIYIAGLRGGHGGIAGNAGPVSVYDNGPLIRTQGTGAFGILAESIGGTGGNGGDFYGLTGEGGWGGVGGRGGIVEVRRGTQGTAIITEGNSADGIVAQSLGGAGGIGGTAGGVVAVGGGSLGSGPADVVVVDNKGNVTTMGPESRGIFAQSVGGHSGAAAGAGGLWAWGGNSESAGDAGDVFLVNRGAIDSRGDSLTAMSIGGGGGRAKSSGGLVTWGGEGSAAGNGASVEVTNSGFLRARDPHSNGITAQSIGGGGGSGSASAGAISFGARGGAGGDGNEVSVVNTRGGIYPELGGIETLALNSSAILAQSLGGGGGSGGGSVSVSAFVGFSMGGSGALGGNSGPVSVDSRLPGGSMGMLSTMGDNSHGIFAQSAGGGGGNGGWAVSLTGGTKGAISVAVGGAGGAGGEGNTVGVFSASPIVTQGNDSNGILAQSVGGGGGNAGFSFAVAASEGTSVALSFGGAGGDGGDGKAVTATSQRAINTSGARSTGLKAQSIGGGGGSGGASAAGALGTVAGASLAWGGSGGGGGHGAPVTVDATGSITTRGQLSYGILAQSLGGGGGDGGLSFALGAASTGTALSAGIGGTGGAGGNAAIVDVTSSGLITTTSGGAHGILAQSVGGGGGAGGYSGTVSASSGTKPNLALSIGGGGGIAGHGQKVSLDNRGSVHTSGAAAYGLFAQSVGGGGGDGGGSFSAALGAHQGGWNGTLNIGGFGQAAGNGGELDVDNIGDITTEGIKSHGLVAQSIGGGGGSGGFSATGAMSKGTGAKDIALSFGGQGAAGGNGGVVDVLNTGDITTQTTVTVGVPEELPDAEDPFDAFGNGAMGILAQSIGGGGGNGGFSFAGAFAGPQAKNVSFSLGGHAGTGGKGMGVNVDNQGMVDTLGANSPAILAQSIGGGGGSGGASVALNFGISDPQGVNVNAGVSLGGGGGDGNAADKVDVINSNAITTRGASSAAIFAQSVGGGGGSGGYSLSGVTTLEPGGTKQPVDVSISVGGGGGNGSHSGIVSVINSGTIETEEHDSSGIFAQSVGGGGGKGGASRAIALDIDVSSWRPKFESGALDIRDFMKDLFSTWNVAVGGAGGGASDGSNVTVANSSQIVTRGDQSYGIFAQSVGGGGGVGGGADTGITSHPWVEALLQFTPLRTAEDLQVSVGGRDGSSGRGGGVLVNNTARVATSGNGASAILAQSIGGGGGIAPLKLSLGEYIEDINLGGGGGATGNAGVVQITHEGQLETAGDGAYGILAASIGGGGGVAGDVHRGVGRFGEDSSYASAGGGAGNGGNVTVTSTGDVTTRGAGSGGIFAQSVGGGGGIAGIGGAGSGFAGSVGGAGSAGAVTVTHTGDITAPGDYSHGIVAQSAGGTGTGSAVSVTFTGAIAATGKNSSGILAQSRGDGGAGNITVTIADDSSVVAGSWDGADPQQRPAAVRFIDGAENKLTNSGAVGAIGGMAVLAGAGNETVDNFGLLAGAVFLGSGTNAIHNHPSAVFASGDFIYVGNGQTFTNDGVLAPGSSVVNTILTGNFVQSATGILSLEIGGLAPGNSDLLNVSGSATLGGALELALTSSFVPTVGDRLTIMKFDRRVGVFSNVTGTAISPTLAFHPRYTPTELVLFTINPTEKTWGIDAGEQTSVGANWFGGAAPSGANESVAFTTVITADRSVRVDAPLSLARLRFDDDNNYTLAGPETITLAAAGDSPANLLVGAIHGNGAHTVSAPVLLADELAVVQQSSAPLTFGGALDNSAGHTLTKTGPGALTIAGAQTHGPGAVLTVSAGIANINTNAGSDTARNLTVNANSTTNFGSTQHLANLSVGAGAKATLTAGSNKVLVSNVPTIAGATGAWTGTIDLMDNDQVAQSSAATKTADFNRLYDQIKSGYAGGAWTGTGITSSAAAASATFETGVSMVDNAIFGFTDFSGQTVNENSILLKYTYYGDIDVNGQVDADDLTIFANNFGKPSGAGQVDGDIDFDADVDADDLTVFANNFGKGIGSPLATGALAAVPEPTSMVLGGIAALVAIAGIYIRIRSCNLRTRQDR